MDTPEPETPSETTPQRPILASYLVTVVVRAAKDADVRALTNAEIAQAITSIVEDQYDDHVVVTATSQRTDK
jgi:hypothetical protein